MLKKAILAAAVISLMLPSAGDAAQVGFFLGDVTLVRQGKNSKVSMGQSLLNGDILKTGRGGLIDITYGDGSKIQIKENSVAQVGSKGLTGSDNVSLVSGNLSASFAKMLKGTRKTYSPTVVAAVRGTDYTMEVSKGGDTRIELTDGKINMSNPFGQSDLEKGKTAESDFSGAPKENETPSGGWLASKDREFDENPSGESEKMAGYISRLDQGTKETGSFIENKGKNIALETNRDKLVKAGVELENVAGKSEDELMLNESAFHTADMLASHYKSASSELYSNFQKVKEESNKVREQQIMNMRAIAEIKEAYKKAYDRIMGTYHEDFEKIMDDSKFKKVLPNMEDFQE